MITVEEIMAQYEHLGLPEEVLDTIVTNTLEAAMKASEEAVESTAAQYTVRSDPPMADPAAWRSRAERIMHIDWVGKVKALESGNGGTSKFVVSPDEESGYDYDD